MNTRPFNRFVNHLAEITKNNKNLKFHVGTNGVTLRYSPGAQGTYVNFTPSNNNRGVELSYGYTRENDRNKGLGKRLRTYGVRAARAAGVTLWQYGVNLNLLVNRNEMPISTYIMRKLGAEWTRGIPKGPGKIAKKKWASIVRGHRYSLRKSVKRSPRKNNSKNELRSPR
jgi:GNAT superfamily N-acetyltransferase